MLRDWSAFHVLAKTFAEGPVCLRIAGLTGAARALAVAELLQAHPRPALVLVESMTDAHHWTQDLKFFGAPALEFPGREPGSGAAGVSGRRTPSAPSSAGGSPWASPWWSS